LPQGQFPDNKWVLMQSRVNWLLLGNIMFANFLIGVSHRIVAISLPTIANSLETDIVGISWTLISYQLASISLSMVFGRIGDLYGRQTIFRAGLVIFTVSSLLSGLAQNVLQLVPFRFTDGIGATMVQASGRVSAMEAAPEGWAGKTQGLINIAYQSGFLFGSTLGGLIIDYIHWRGIFFFLVPFGAAAAALTWLNDNGAKAGNTPGVTPPASIDYLGASLLVVVTIAMIAILDPRLMAIIGTGWQIGFVVVFVALFFGFILHEATTASPIIELSLFRIRQFTFSTLCLLLVAITQALSLFLLPFYFQEILLLSPTFMGLLFMTMPIFGITLAPLGGFLFDRVGPRLPATTGIIFYGGAALLGRLLQTDSHWFLPTIMLALGGCGTALFYPANHTAMISSVPREHRGVASGAIYMIFGLGDTLGIALGRFLMTALFRFHTGLSEASPTTANPTVFVAAMNTTFLVIAILNLIAVVCSLARGKNPAALPIPSKGN